ncbi:Thiol-disulfide oxidoreductase ResA [Rubripirellula amarantea]|uniref:Thiol-disulfide oxidoreductase ResA n=1 Tax=Rubripirellula amarantea TaxID=2527999 RepID=A0A5C5WC52_9BACT|nr:redoxin domain-containing protein [Rubripirellula amarantea]TWT48097.1 Thiol-disulfide oxidoreductase ResA [Rubripirellula amarantea]
MPRSILGSLTCLLFSVVSCSDALAVDKVQLQPVLLQMIRDTAIHEELSLSSDQVGTVLGQLPEIDGPWFRARNLQPAEQTRVINELTDALRSRLADTLTPQQSNRLRQLERQALGTRMVLRQDVVDELDISDDQLSRFNEAAAKTETEAAAVQKEVFDGKIDNRAAGKRVEALQKEERTHMVATLNENQRAMLSKLTGKPFDFGKIKRMYPLAPELEDDGVTWIQGGPLTLSELRGKVVAVHFYAFQCINCQRNFPHYKAWHKDYEDDGLVVIGIQTPETPAERRLEKVSAAVKNDGFEFPTMLDAESSNWKAWHNTMWPTVYLIDKEGFLRRWWQGELNWNGTPGEQQMRDTIEILLAE